MEPQAEPKPKWNAKPVDDGLACYQISSWTHFFDFLEAEVFPATEEKNHRYIWRGQRSSEWPLNSSLDRLFDRLEFLGAPPEELDGKSLAHLTAFKFAARGRRGHNPAQLDENNWWALGQHFGLATPLLDWSTSPFAAAYFAFEELAANSTDNRVVWALDRDAVAVKNDEINRGPSIEKGRPPVVEILEPMLDENYRLVSQGGLFTRSPLGLPIDRWVQQAFESSSKAILLRIEIPNSDRVLALRTLNRMNINHLSLFPDLAGASRSTNLKLELGI